MVKNIFRFFVIVMLSLAGLVLITPVISFNDLLYPVRIDSAYVSRQQFVYEKQLTSNQTDSGEVFIYSPQQLNIHYMNMSYTLRDSVTLKGWMAIDTLHMSSPLLLIIPDISEGAICYLSSMKQFCDRGFNVCVMDLRAQGESEGAYYTLGQTSADDVKQLIADLRKLPFVSNIALMGSGTGAAIALKTMKDSAYAEALILQNPLVSLDTYFHEIAVAQWGNFILPVLPPMIRRYESKTGLQVSNYDYVSMISDVTVPVMVTAANFMDKKIIEQALTIYKASPYVKKQLYIDAASFMIKTRDENSKTYYDKIGAFISISMPSKSKKTRFRKLAFQ